MMGCGEEVANLTDRQADAVTVATDATCDRYEKCGEVGDGKTYTSRSDCESRVRAFWNDQWPASDCEGHISGDGLTTCTDRIKSTECGSFVDALATAYVSCSKSDVCR